MLEEIFISDILTSETIGILLAGSMIWLCLKWRKTMRLEETFIGIQLIED